MKKVAHFLRKSVQLESSFLQNQILNHIKFDPIVLCKYRSDDDVYSFADFNYASLPIIPIDVENTFFSKILFRYLRVITKKDAKKINRVLEESKIDILHFHYGSDAGIFWPILKQTRIPSVVSFYGYDAHSFPKRFLGFGASYLKKRVFKYVSNVLVMSEEMKKDLLDIGCPEEKISIHYHGVPDTLSRITGRSYSNKTIKLLIVSYLDPVKGHFFVLESLQKLVQKGIRNFEFNIIGDGFYKEEIRNKIIELGLQEYVNVLGPVKYNSSKFKKAFTEADIFVHPSVTTKSDKEGIPGALVEAMFAGLPVISTYHGGIPYIIQHEQNGFMVNEWDVENLSEIIIKLIRDKDLRKKIGESARKYAKKNLTLKKREENLEKIYDFLINKKDHLIEKESHKRSEYSPAFDTGIEKIVYITTAKKGLPAFTYKELLLLEQNNINFTLCLTQLNNGVFLPKENWEVLIPNKLRLFTDLISVLFGNPVKLLKLMRDAQKKGILRWLIIAINFFTKLRTKNISSVHCQMGGSKLYIGYFLSQLMKKRLTVTIHAYELYYEDAYRKTDVMSEIYNYCSKILTISDFNREQLVTRFKVNPDKIERMYLYPANYDRDSEKKKILVIGNWMKQKGFSFLFDTIDKLDRDDYIIWIIGGFVPDENAIDLQEMVDARGLNNKVHLFGFQPAEVVNIMLKACDIFCLPSVTVFNKEGRVTDREGIPISLMEAMIYKKPVVSTFHAGIPELVKDFLVKENDIDDLLKILNYLLDNPLLWDYIGERNKKIIDKKFNEKNVDILISNLKNNS